jgi:hypothetical protein
MDILELVKMIMMVTDDGDDPVIRDRIIHVLTTGTLPPENLMQFVVHGEGERHAKG